MSPMPKKKHLEADVKESVKKLLTDHGWFWFMPPASAYAKVGISDFLAVKHGMFMALETKRGVKAPKPTANQIAFLQSIKANNHLAFVVNEPRLFDLANFLYSLNKAQAAAMRKEQVAEEDGAAMIDAIREMQKEL
jgi:penicillin-binding protein-related factor A (putative recombinase)